MSWRAITEADVLAVLTEPERIAVDESATGDQGSPVAAVIVSATAEARDRIAAHSANKLDADASTVPEGMVHHLVAIIRYRLLSRLPVQSLITEARTQEYRDARNYLTDVAKGLVSIEQPVSADTTPRKQMRPSIAAREKRFSRSQQDGI